MHHLVENRHVARPLEHLDEVVVRAGQHRRSRVESQDAPLVHVPVLRTGVTASRFLAGRHPRLPLARVRRKATGRRIDDQRRASRASDPRAAGEPELVVAARVTWSRRPIDPTRSGLRLQVGDVFVGEEFLAGQRGGAFQGRHGAKIPDALQVRVTFRRSRDERCVRRGRLCGGGEGLE